MFAYTMRRTPKQIIYSYIFAMRWPQYDTLPTDKNGQRSLLVFQITTHSQNNAFEPLAVEDMMSAAQCFVKHIFCSILTTCVVLIDSWNGYLTTTDYYPKTTLIYHGLVLQV